MDYSSAVLTTTTTYYLLLLLLLLYLFGTEKSYFYVRTYVRVVLTWGFNDAELE